MRDQKAIFFLLIFVFMLHTGTLRKQEDPILKTQTDPILYKQKMEEIKDGEKGPPTPSWKLYPKEKFLVEPPVEIKKDEKAPISPNKIPVLGESIPENLEDTNQVAPPSDLDKQENENQDWWEGEDTAGKSDAGPAGEDAAISSDRVKEEDQKAETH